MELSKKLLADISTLLSVVQKDKNAEAECKVLAGKIQTKDVADRIVKAIEGIALGAPKEEHRATFSYADGLRVSVVGPENIHKVCVTNNFRGVPLTVERKRKYYDLPTAGSGVDMLDVPELDVRFTLRHEEPLRRDFTGTPMDPSSYLRVMHRKTWITVDGRLQIDMSLVKTKQKSHKTFSDVLRQTPSYELEIEVLDREKDVVAPMLSAVETIVAAYQQSPFVLPKSDIQRYQIEFEAMKTPFINPVTMERRHINRDRPYNVLSGYTVTNKADGDRCFLVVMRDRRVIRITPRMQVAWTGLTALKDGHFGDILDGEYLPERNLFCIFDVYSYRGKDTRRLPLMTTDADVAKNPTNSRLGCAIEFVKDIAGDFKTPVGKIPIRIETKLFLAGDGRSMEESICKMLDTKFEYPTDGLIFTPRASQVAPPNDRTGNTWLRVYKWKPADQNSIDFLVRFAPGESYDPVLKSRVFKGTLYVSRSPGSDVIYPCETMTGEYVQPRLPDDLRISTEHSTRIPSPFQPSIPRDTEAYNIMLPLSDKGIPVDKTGTKIEDNTIIECVRDVDTGRWGVLRTRYDKTYEYRVMKKPQYGNDIKVAESIWTNIHVPITEEMIRSVASVQPDDTFEDDLYYRDNLDARDRILKDVYGFHNRIKDKLYQSSIKAGDTLLELAVGRGGDLQKWKKARVSLVVGVDISASNLESPRQGACVRYLKDRQEHPADVPPILFIRGDMSQPLYKQDSHYFRILSGEEPAPTPYLEKFHKITKFDAIACQMAMHYACESEETFRVFAKNLTTHGKGLFFGTCLDGRSVYSLLLGKPGHTFRSETRIFGEFTKDYNEGERWIEDFGKSVRVHLESFEQPQKEYLVPFEKVVDVLREVGYELVSTLMFNDYYAQQNRITLTVEQQAFSFLHRSFVFKKVKPVAEPEVAAEAEAEAVVKPEEAEAEAKPEEEKPKPKTKIIRKKVAVPPTAVVEEPVLFFGSDESKGEFRMFDPGYEAAMEIGEVPFKTLTHYVEWTKAVAFEDKPTAAKIIKTATAKAVTALGNKVENYDEDVWDEQKDAVMAKGVRAKFTQHPEIRAKLLETGTRPIGYADARDKYWSIGTSADKEKAKDPSKWPGKNVLGKILMDLRKELSAS